MCTGMRDVCYLWYSSSWARGLCWYKPISSSQPLVPVYWQWMSSPALQPHVVLFLGEGLRKCLDDPLVQIITTKGGHSQEFYVPGNFVELQYLSTWQLCSILMPDLQRKSQALTGKIPRNSSSQYFQYAWLKLLSRLGILFLNTGFI